MSPSRISPRLRHRHTRPTHSCRRHRVTCEITGEWPAGYPSQPTNRTRSTCVRARPQFSILSSVFARRASCLLFYAQCNSSLLRFLLCSPYSILSAAAALPALRRGRWSVTPSTSFSVIRRTSLPLALFGWDRLF